MGIPNPAEGLPYGIIYIYRAVWLAGYYYASSSSVKGKESEAGLISGLRAVLHALRLPEMESVSVGDVAALALGYDLRAA